MSYQQPVRRRGRGLRALVITLVVLAVLLVVADRVGDYVAEQVAADTIRTSQHLDSTPDVDVAGFPFLTQLAAGDFDQITVDAADVPVGEQGHILQLDHMRVVLDRVHVSRDFSAVHAESALATANVGYGQLSRTLGVDVRYTGDGRIRASKKITVLGETFTPTITVQPRIANGALEFADPTINGVANGADAAADLLKRYFDLAVPFANLPFDVKVRSLSVASAGLVISLTGTDLTYSKDEQGAQSSPTRRAADTGPGPAVAAR